MVTRVAVGAVVLRDDGTVLLVERGRPPLEGTWSLPGGRVELGEELARAVEREVLEETGLAVVAGAVVEVVKLSREGYDYEIHEFVCMLRDPSDADTARAGDDARAVRWCKTIELEGLHVTSDVRRVIDVARRRR